MCKITYYVWNKIIQGSLSRSVWKKFLSLEKFYTHIVADVADYYRPNLKCALRPATCDLSQNTKCDLFPGKWSHFNFATHLRPFSG